MNKKLSIGFAVFGVGVALLVVHNLRSRSRATYQGIPISTWAAAFYPNFNPSSTNEAVIAFREMVSNAVPTLLTMLKAREPWYAKLFVQQGKKLPASARGYLARTIKPGQTGASRVAAARALGIIGTNATVAVPDLIATLNDFDVRWASAQALASIGGPAISALAAAATDKDMNVRHAAVYGLGQAGTNASAATSVLLDCVLDLSQFVQASALYSLGQIGQSGLPTVLTAFSDTSAARREAAARAVKAMNSPPRQVLSTVLTFSTNASPELRRDSLIALQALRVNHPRVVVTYFEATGDSNSNVRAEAARALGHARDWSTNAALSDAVVRLLGRSGTFDSNVLATLTTLLADSEMPVRDAARETLARLQISSAN